MAKKKPLPENTDLKGRVGKVDGLFAKMNASDRQVGQPFRPRMTDPASGRKMRKGQPVDNAGPSLPSVPDPDASMPADRLKYHRNKNVALAPDTPGNRRTGSVGRALDPTGGRPLAGMGGSVMRKGQPSVTGYSGDLKSKVELGLQRGLATAEGMDETIFGRRKKKGR